MSQLLFSEKKSQVATLHINENDNKIKISAPLFRYTDRETLQIVFYIPSLDISAYGETEAKAKEMLEFSINEFCSWITDFPLKKITIELASLGWDQSKLNEQEFTQTILQDVRKLQNLNALENQVAQLTIEG